MAINLDRDHVRYVKRVDNQGEPCGCAELDAVVQTTLYVGKATFELCPACAVRKLKDAPAGTDVVVEWAGLGLPGMVAAGLVD